MKLIVGLGNPEKKYFKTRHNVGFLVLDDLQKQLADFPAWQENKKFKAAISAGKINNEKVILAKPSTYMNNSGQSVRALVDFYKIKPENIYLVHDDIDIALGKIKVKKTGSSAGHKGVQSVIDHLKTQDFNRFRIGIQPEGGQKGRSEDLVLKKFGLTEKSKVKECLKETAKTIKQVLA